MLDDHAKIVAKRHAHEYKNDFFKYLRWCGWEEEQIEEMWQYIQRFKNKEKEE